MKMVGRLFRDYRAEAAASLGLLLLYLAVMSGHFLSIDGLVMWRQAIAMTYHQSWSFVPPIWWGGYITSSGRGVGASLQYVPGLLVFPWLSGHVPVQPSALYDYKLFYGDVLYIVAGAPVWAIMTAASAYLVGLITRALGFERTQALWAMAFYGIGSPAFAASRGDWPQPIVAICWAVGVYASLRYRETRGHRWLCVSGAAIVYAVLTRPLEGSLLLPGVLILVVLPKWRDRLLVGVSQVGAWSAAALATLVFDWARFGSPFNFGYGGALRWTTPIWYGFPSALLSPGRGVLWEFPALMLAVLGIAYLWGHGHRIEAAALVSMPAALFLEACTYFDWVGGWDWGFRFIQPALPLLAAGAGAGIVTLPRSLRVWLPAVLLTGGILWNIPAITTDLLAGYGAVYAENAPNWQLDAYPPIGAWRFLHHILPTSGLDGSSIDIVWFRATRVVGKIALLPFAVLLAAAAAFWSLALKAASRTRPMEA